MTLKRTVSPTKVPGIPKPPAEISVGLRRYLENLSEAVEIRLGRRGDQRDRAITLRELIDSGLAVELAERPFDPNAGGSTFVPSNETIIDSTVPPAPTNFTATGAFSTVILFWDKPIYRNHSLTEIWRNDADIVGDAQLVGVSSAISFIDPVGEGSAYYYWARHVSDAGIIGPFHAVNGAFAETAPDVEYLLDLLTGSITESQLFQDLGSRIDLIDADATVVNSVAYRLAQETAARIAAIAATDNAIAQEIADRIAALAQEVADRNSAITDAVAAEAEARAAAVLAASQTLQSQINDLLAVTEYDNATTYDVGDQVTYNGKLYRAIAVTTGNLPTDTNFWVLLGDYTSLGDFVGQNAALISEINNVSATSTSASAQTLAGLQAVVTDPNTGLVATRATLFNDYYTSVTVDSAIASATTGLASETFVTDGLANYTTTADLTVNYYTKTEADSAISSAVLGLASETFVTNGLANYTTTADLTTNYYTKTDADSAISAAVLGLASETFVTNGLANYTTTADLTTNYYTKTDADSAISAAVSNLASTTYVNTNLANYTTTADLTTNYYTKTAADLAISAAVQNLASETFVTTNLANYTTTADLTTNYYTKTAADSAISAAVQNLASTTYVNTNLANYTTTADLETNYYTITDTDQAIASAVVGLASTTDLGNYVTTATLTGSYYTASATDSAISTAVQTLASTVGNNTAAIQTNAESVDGLEAQYTVKIDNNGYVSGFGLASTPVDGVPFSEFIVRADRFAIGSGNTDIIPFVVTTTTTTLNGETVPAGVYISEAFIKNGAISNAKIGVLSADKITTGELDAERIGASTITSTKLAADSVTAEKLAISSSTDGTASSIYMDSNGAIKVYDASGNLRVKIGNLSA